MSSWLLKTFLLNINPCLVLNHALHVFNEILRLDCFIFSNSYAFTCNLLFLLNKNVEENNRFFKCFHVPCNTYYRSSCGELETHRIYSIIRPGWEGSYFPIMWKIVFFYCPSRRSLIMLHITHTSQKLCI